MFFSWTHSLKKIGYVWKKVLDGWIAWYMVWLIYDWLMDGWMDELMDGWMDGQMDGQMDGWTDGWIAWRMDWWMDGWTYNEKNIVRMEKESCQVHFWFSVILLKSIYSRLHFYLFRPTWLSERVCINFGFSLALSLTADSAVTLELLIRPTLLTLLNVKPSWSIGGTAVGLVAYLQLLMRLKAKGGGASVSLGSIDLRNRTMSCARSQCLFSTEESNSSVACCMMKKTTQQD